MAIPEDRQQAALRGAQVTPLDRAGAGPTTIIFEVDGRQLAKTTVPHLPRELRIRGVGV